MNPETYKKDLRILRANSAPCRGTFRKPPFVQSAWPDAGWVFSVTCSRLLLISIATYGIHHGSLLSAFSIFLHARPRVFSESFSTGVLFHIVFFIEFFQRVFSQRFLTLAANVVISAKVKKRSPLQRLLENNSGCLEIWVVSIFAWRSASTTCKSSRSNTARF